MITLHILENLQLRIDAATLAAFAAAMAIVRQMVKQVRYKTGPHDDAAGRRAARLRDLPRTYPGASYNK
jgi:hypothetical protein